MRKNILFVMIVGGIVMGACQKETADPKFAALQSAWKVFGYVEDDLEQIVELFENSLRLDQNLSAGDSLCRYTRIQDWWGVMDGNGCRFKVLRDDKSLDTLRAVWIARTKYYSNDSIRVECTGRNQWVLTGFCKGHEKWRTEAFLKITCVDDKALRGDWDSVVFLIEGTGVLHLTEMYPSRNMEITFSIPEPLLRRNCVLYSPYAFTEGKMNIHIEDMNNKRKENAVIEIEELPLNERMVRVISRGITKVHSYK